MKKLFLLLLTLVSTNVLFGVRPSKKERLSQTINPANSMMSHFQLPVVPQQADNQAQKTTTSTPKSDLFAHILTKADMDTQTLPLQNVGAQTKPLTNATDRQQLLMDRVTASAAAVILARLKHA